MGGDKPDLVLVGSGKYTHDAFAAAFHQAFLDILESKIRAGSDRALLRAVRDLRSDGSYQRALARALRTLISSPQFDGDGVIVAVYPRPVDNQTATQ